MADLIRFEPIPSKGIGMVACRDLEPRTVLIQETPILRWSRGSFEPVQMIPIIAQAPILQRAIETLSPSREFLRHQAALFEQAYRAIHGLRFERREDPKWSSLKTGSDPDGDEEWPVSHEYARWYIILETNAFPMGLCPTIARANHACHPNAQVIELDDGRYQLQTLGDKIPARQEILISYLSSPECMTKRERQRHLQAHYHFECECELCRQPEPVLCLSHGHGQPGHLCRLPDPDTILEMEGEVAIAFEKARHRPAHHAKALLERTLMRASAIFPPDHILIRRLRNHSEVSWK